MAKRGSSGNGEAQYVITQANLDRKGKTNKKAHKVGSLASKYMTPKGKELIEAAAAFAKAHPKGSGKKYRKVDNSAS